METGEALEALRRFPDCSFDSMITDPPAGISFMGKSWDTDRGGRDQWVSWLTQILTEANRVLKPGAHILVWALPKTSHWTATAIENSGFEIRDKVQHIFGSGFPKSKNPRGRWTGFGTALKPTHEEWILGRKPLVGTLDQNLELYSTGVLNIDGCRIPTTERLVRPAQKRESQNAYASGLGLGSQEEPGGRWPANVVLSHTPACGDIECSDACPVLCLNACNASRFFYVAKPSKGERNLGHITNTHPTVKPVDLMRHLCRLITPPSGLILDPFAGSGSTGVAAMLENMGFCGIEQDATYADIARARIAAFHEASE